MNQSQAITIDGMNYPLDGLSPSARETILSLQFVDARLQQLQNEWAVADTARLAYSAALKRELLK